MAAPIHQQSYSTRASRHSNPAAKALLEVMDRKKTNLCVSVDVTKKNAFLRIVEAAGPSVCLVKTHIDIIEDFDEDLVYSRGVHKIASWSHITNAHPVPGPGIVKGLASVGLPLGRGLLLLAEMSSQGTLAQDEYTKQAVAMARAHQDFVIGFIAMKRLKDQEPTSASNEDEDFLILTPGVGLDTKGDGMGQQYKTPREVVLERGCDVIIVGRGIYGKGEGADSEAIKAEAERYRAEGWRAYEERIAGKSLSSS
ncbi:orotidine 5'-phosphate decarboxylase [Tulasnella sp. 427]|nr:orotidine 5'-phosphate decarboxylase [Tulasnella sp. 427]